MTRVNGGKVLDVIMKVAVVLACSIASWSANSIIDLKVDVAAINSNRFTDEDGAILRREVADVRTAIAALPKEVPPPWFKAEVDRLQQEIKDLSKAVAKLESAVENRR